MEGSDLYDQLMKEIVSVEDAEDEHILLHEVEMVIDSVDGSLGEDTITGLDQSLHTWMILLLLFGIGVMGIYRYKKQTNKQVVVVNNNSEATWEVTNNSTVDSQIVELINEFRKISINNDAEVSNYKSKWENIAPIITTTLVTVNRELHLNAYHRLSDVEIEVLMDKMNEYKHALIHIISVYEVRKQLIKDEPYCNIESATTCRKLTRELSDITRTSSLSNISELRDVMAYFSACGLNGLAEFELAENKLKELYSLEDENDAASYRQRLNTDLNEMFQLYNMQVSALPSPQRQQYIDSSSNPSDVALSITDAATTTDLITASSDSSMTLSTAPLPHASAELHLRSTWLLETDRQRRLIELEIVRNKKRKDEIRDNERETARREAMQKKEKTRNTMLLELEKQKHEAQGMQHTLDKKYHDLLAVHSSRKAALDGWDYFWAIVISVSSVLTFAIVSSKCILKHDPLQWFIDQLTLVCTSIQSCDSNSGNPPTAESSPSQLLNEVYNYTMSKFMYNAIALMLRLGIDTNGWTLSSLVYCAVYVTWRLFIPLSISYFFSLIGLNMKIYGNLTIGNVVILFGTYFAFQNKLTRLYEYSHSLGSLLLCHGMCYIALNACDRQLTWRFVWRDKLINIRWLLCRVAYPLALLCICIVIGCLNQADSSRGIKLSLKSNVLATFVDTVEECFIR